MVSEIELESVAKRKLRDTLPFFSARDTIRAERMLDRLHLEYIAASATSDLRDATYLQMRLVTTSRVVWIRFLHVAREFRLRGMGRQLIYAAEGVARELGAARINVFPLMPARLFWVRAGYQPHCTMTRVLTKELNIANSGN